MKAVVVIDVDKAGTELSSMICCIFTNSFKNMQFYRFALPHNQNFRTPCNACVRTLVPVPSQTNLFLCILRVSVSIVYKTACTHILCVQLIINRKTSYFYPFVRVNSALTMPFNVVLLVCVCVCVRSRVFLGLIATDKRN